MNQKLRVILSEDQGMILGALAALLETEPDISVVGRASNGREALRCIATHMPDVLVTDMTDPDWEPIMKKASAIITNKGGRTCHAAIVAREMGLPAIVGCSNATEYLSEGQLVTASCASRPLSWRRKR